MTTTCMTTPEGNDIFSGMAATELQAALLNAQRALIELQLGGKGVKFSYTQGNGSKTVEYTPTSTQQLTALILQLQQKLGITCRARRPARFIY